MTDPLSTPDDDLTGTADERRAQLARLEATPSAEWLLRQLESVLDAWADDETSLDIDREARTDY